MSALNLPDVLRNGGASISVATPAARAAFVGVLIDTHNDPENVIRGMVAIIESGDFRGKSISAYLRENVIGDRRWRPALEPTRRAELARRLKAETVVPDGSELDATAISVMLGVDKATISRDLAVASATPRSTPPASPSIEGSPIDNPTPRERTSPGTEVKGKHPANIPTPARPAPTSPGDRPKIGGREAVAGAATAFRLLAEVKPAVLREAASKADREFLVLLRELIDSILSGDA